MPLLTPYCFLVMTPGTLRAIAVTFVSYVALLWMIGAASVACVLPELVGSEANQT